MLPQGMEIYIVYFPKKKFKKIDFIFKVSKFNNFNDIINQIENFKKKINRNKIYSILFHNLNDLKKKKNVELFLRLKKNKKKYNISKVGFSVNSFINLEKFLKKLNPDIIQVPFSIMDRRVLHPKYQKIFKEKKLKFILGQFFYEVYWLKENLIK